MIFIKTKEAIIVEGKYDKLKLQSTIDSLIVVTNGFRIFSDKDKLNFIKYLAKSCGIIIFTDSDKAGYSIRKYITTAIKKGVVKHAYIPKIEGKEKRKRHYSFSHTLGLEGIDKDIIIKSLLLAKPSLCYENPKSNRNLLKKDFYKFGLSGGTMSTQKRHLLIQNIGLPYYSTTKDLICFISETMSYDEFISKLKNLYII